MSNRTITVNFNDPEFDSKICLLGLNEEVAKALKNFTQFGNPGVEVTLDEQGSFKSVRILKEVN